MEKTASLEELIKREYRTMVCTMAFGEITVSELCKRVGISRKSFYTYFESRDDVLARILYDDIGAPIEKIFPLFRNQNAPVSVPIMNTMVYQAILDHKEFYQRLVTQNQERIFVHAFQKCLMVSHTFTNDTLGGKKGDVPKPVAPPEPGWFERAEAEAQRREDRARRWVAAHS